MFRKIPDRLDQTCLPDWRVTRLQHRGNPLFLIPTAEALSLSLSLSIGTDVMYTDIDKIPLSVKAYSTKDIQLLKVHSLIIQNDSIIKETLPS